MDLETAFNKMIFDHIFLIVLQVLGALQDPFVV